ncbi:ComF family protein [Anaerobacillus isosaccharinicus]|uniref:ComF family protein n=1 Tax=Anaerobacillus isosaccharinicus TaxID=1532552 RepID=A0A1S2LAF3_9BACI|nr:ComF family protein [Anaerobacillus isosaccharinicus]MBA5584601.1 ComF family protein [Anaerobacillus isosaccharinicus]QOY37020.1 ComF family protein [Anaerobacillus isosaccharinicus]
MHCLSCHSPFIEKISWQHVFGISVPRQLCEECTKKLEKITGDLCEKCGRPFLNLDAKYRKGDLCNDCVRWGEGALTKSRSIYVYNEFLQEVIAKWKYRGDAELVKLFRPELQNLTEQFEIDVVVPIPLSKGRLYERSFNQSKALAEGLPYPIIEALMRPDEAEKQSKKSRKERLHREERFQMVPSFLYDLQGKTVLLVDDIYTTGATLYSAANTLKEQGGAGPIFSITVARG